MSPNDSKNALGRRTSPAAQARTPECDAVSQGRVSPPRSPMARAAEALALVPDVPTQRAEYRRRWGR
ncbi:hypothetical protein ACFV4P_23395 [Kitasatospora sp. NPDC059795]|uniref:hypothetical protein n=1 Tax=Kitasatospora sp. NPDC059795 TaxID=3346949 RepID=UPI0036507536